MKKQPEKTAQTKQSIIDAFWQLAKKKGVKHVVISEITKKAGLNRGTFYVYFTDLDDLLYQAEEEIISDLMAQISENTMGSMDVYALTKKATETIGLYDDKLFLLLGRNGDPLFLERMRKEFSQIFSTMLPSLSETKNQDYKIAYITAAFTGLLQYWYENGKNIPLTELSEVAYTMLLDGVMGNKSQNE